MTRLIVKGLPACITEDKLRKIFNKYGTVTDISLKYTKDGIFRKFAFVGYENEESSQNAIQTLNNTFIQTSKVVVEECLPFSCENKPRPWSKYTKGSSAYKRLHENEEIEDSLNNVKKSKLNSNNLNESKVLKSEKDFECFMQDQGILIDSPPALNCLVDEKKISSFIEKFQGNKKLSLLYRSLPLTLKQKNFKEWVMPVKLNAVNFYRFEKETVAIATFNRPQDLKRALKQNDQFLGGYKIKVTKLIQQVNGKNLDDLKKKEQNFEEQNQKIKEIILDTGRLFIRNLPYICNEGHLMEIFRQFGEIAEIQCIIDKKSGKCKGFAIVTFIFPENAYNAFEKLDGKIFKGRMLHILPGETKLEIKEANNNEKNFKRLSKVQSEREKILKANAGQEYNWNPLFMGANATAETLAERLELEKRDLLIGKGDNSAAVRLAMAETQLVKETREFLLEKNIGIDKYNGQRSNTIIIVKNVPGIVFEEQLKKLFEKFGSVKKFNFSPCGLSAIVEMENSVDAKRAFNFIAYSHLKDSNQPLYLEWGAQKEIKKENDEQNKDKNENDFESNKIKTKILIRNIPFQASLEEVQQLFSVFGEIRDIRLPKKVGIRNSSHRGFGFVDFVSHSDSKRAMDLLCHSTHLYGRRLVLEWAKVDDSITEIRKKTINKLNNQKIPKSTKKDIRDAVENYQSDDDI